MPGRSDRLRTLVTRQAGRILRVGRGRAGTRHRSADCRAAGRVSPGRPRRCGRPQLSGYEQTRRWSAGGGSISQVGVSGSLAAGMGADLVLTDSESLLLGWPDRRRHRVASLGWAPVDPASNVSVLKAAAIHSGKSRERWVSVNGKPMDEWTSESAPTTLATHGAQGRSGCVHSDATGRCVSYMRSATTRPDAAVMPAMTAMAGRMPNRSAIIPATSAPTA
jgi:hypothetical protein